VPARTIVVAGAGIGGLTASLALAAKGFRVTLLDKAERLEETGAGIQLSPNATRVLLGLGLRERLSPTVVAPEVLIIRPAGGREIARLRLGAEAAARYGAPYWMIHRGDLQAALLDAVRAHQAIALTLDAAVDACTVRPDGVTVRALRKQLVADINADALVGADGLWSKVRSFVAEPDEPSFARRTAWRALVPAEHVAPDFRTPAVHLWLGHGSHLVHYPVKGGAMINIVAIAADAPPRAGASQIATSDEVIAHFSDWFWSKRARDLIALPMQWLKWPLYRRPQLRPRHNGPVTLVGDAAHPMLPLLAQGAAMAIEDAAVLAGALAATPADAVAAMRHYETVRRPRTMRVERAARRNDLLYHLPWPVSVARDLAMGQLGHERLLAQFDWIYGWRPE
jgi:salicylate hydroxylase